MIDFNANIIRDMIATYVYEDIKGREPEVYDALSYLNEKFQEIEMWSFQNGEVERVLNSFRLCADSEMTRENEKAVRGVKVVDVAFIAAHYGFMFGLVWSENRRLKFYEEKINE